MHNAENITENGFVARSFPDFHYTAKGTISKYKKALRYILPPYQIFIMLQNMPCCTYLVMSLLKPSSENGSCFIQSA